MSSPRKSLQELFPDLNISQAKDGQDSARMMNLSKSLGKAFSVGWPHWHNAKTKASATVHYNINLSEHLRDDAKELAHSLGQDPVAIISQVRGMSQSGGFRSFAEIWEQLERSLILLVYGSNIIESAGSSYQITFKLCQDVFRGRPVSTEIGERDPGYQEHLENLARTNRPTDKANIIQSRREIVSHAKALNYLIDRVVLNGETWTEDLILKTHAILYQGLHQDVTPGRYRDHEVAVRYGKPGQRQRQSVCMRAAAVPDYMKRFVEDLNKDISASEGAGQIDPYTLAARYHHQFVMIHPFGDGNGRMSRLILNVLLLKYAGHVAPIGIDDDREEYLDVVRRGRKVFDEEDMEVDFSQQTSHLETAKLILRRSKQNLLGMRTWLTQKCHSPSGPTLE